MIRASAPGKIMLAGEYAILSQGRALAQTIDARLRVSIAPAKDGLTIMSNLWKSKKTFPKDLEDSRRIGANEPVLESIAFFLKTFPSRLNAEIVISSDLDVSHGVGSSSALRIALFSVLSRFLGLGLDKDRIATLAYLDQRQSQSNASGYDILTQVYGGSVLIKKPNHGQWPLTLENIECPHLDKIQIWVGGTGAPTKSTIANTKNWLDSDGKMDTLIEISEDLIDTFLLSSSKDLLLCIDRHREFFKESPMFPLRVEKNLRPFFEKGIWSWKTTGAGGEDAILLIGAVPLGAQKALNELGWYRASYQFSQEGLRDDD